MTRWAVLVLAVAVVLAALPATAVATWSDGAAGNAAAKAIALPAGATPAASVSGRSVTVSWSPTTIGAGATPDGYVVKRYGADDQPRTVGDGCAGTVSATTCTESAVLAGEWRYTVAPRRGNWIGAESAFSAVATVEAPALSFTSSTVSTLPATLSGTLANFAGGETVTFRLDDATSGTILTGTTTPSPLGSDGSASVSVTLPSGTTSGAHTVYAVDGQGSVASAPVTVAAVACPNTAPALSWINGLETATLSSLHGGVGAAVDSTVKRNGSYSLRVAPVNGTAYRSHFPGVGTFMGPSSVRFAMRLDELPSANSDLAGFVDDFDTPAPYFTLKYVAATGKLAIGFPGQTVSASSTVVAGRWHVIDMRLDWRTSTQTADWRVDGVDQPSTSYTQTSNGASAEFYWGSRTAATYTANFDDFAVAANGTEYPIGDGAVLPLLLDGMGTSVNPTNFRNDDATALDATSWSRLDDLPMGGGTDGVKQVTNSGISYAEMTFQNTAETCVRAVMGKMTYDRLGTNGANNGKTTIVADGVERTVYSGSMVASSAGWTWKEAMVAPSTVAWTPASVNALRGRVGYSTDASPQPSWQALMLEYDTPR